MRRYSDGLPARKGDKYFEEGPYFGLSINKENQNPIIKNDGHTNSNNTSFRNKKGAESLTFNEDVFI